ncbi:hypothetical protein Ancab_001212 [Ancistrocladus abbreviatus]
MGRNRGVSPPSLKEISQSSGAVRGRRLYKEVVENNTLAMVDRLTGDRDTRKHKPNRILQAEALKRDLQWLKECYVGETYAIDQVPGLQDQFQMEGCFGCIVQLMGERRC